MMRRTAAFCFAFAMLCSTVCGEDKPAAKSAEAAVKPSPPADKPFKADPAGRDLYKQMIKAMRKADTLSYISRYGIEGKAFKFACTYRAWLKKPNYFRIESERDPSEKKPPPPEAGGGGGILIGDGNLLWIYWPKGRFRCEWEDAKDYEKVRLTSYIKKGAPPGSHSIGHEVGYLGSGVSMPVIDPSTFHGYTDSLQAYLDGVMSLGSEKIGDEDCDKIEVSIMKHQRSWFLWLSKRDHLPRKMREIVRVSYDIIITEDWSSVIVNGDIPDKMFVWRPPKGWTQYKEPPLSIGLLKSGAVAPDFDLPSIDGGQVKLSDFRGKLVWLNVWRAG